MSNLLANSDVLKSRFVYYKRLRRDAEDYNSPSLGALYGHLMNEGDRVIGMNNTSARAEQISKTLRAQAKVEAQKEAALLNEYFKYNISVDDLYTKEIGKTITKAYNETLQLKEVFERSVTRLLGDESHQNVSKISITSVMDSYFFTELKNKWNTIKGHIEKNLGEGMSIEDAIDKEFQSKYMDSIIEAAFTKAMESSTWSNTDDAPFKEVLAFLEKKENVAYKNDIMRSLWNDLGIDKFKETLKQEVHSIEEFKAYKKGSKKKKSKLQTNVEGVQKRGLFAEQFSRLTGIIASELKGVQFDNKTMRAEQVGQYEAKPDVIFTFGLSLDPIISRLEQERGSDRLTNKKRFQEIDEHLKRLKSGFIVYSNVKDWTIVKKVDGFRGFSSGSSITLRKFAETIDGQKYTELIGAISNTLTGAVYDAPRYREAITQFIAQDIAAFLFDDIKSVGVERSGAQSIHVMNLDGIYIPISYLMLLLAEAFEGQEKVNYKGLFEPYIRRSNKILYEEHGEGQPNGIWTHEDWERQKEDALDNIKIGAKFARNFEQLIKELVE